MTEIEIFAHIPMGPGNFDGPEGIVLGADGYLSVSSGDGWIYRISPSGQVMPYVEVGGRPLGLTYDRGGRLFVCEVCTV